MTIETLVEESLKLKPLDKFRLANIILESVDVGQPDIDKMWGEEAERRLVAVQQGALKTIDLDDFIREYQ